MNGNVYEWYVVYTKSGMELKVSKALTKKSVENYCPVSNVQAKWWSLKKSVQQPLFTSYVFVKTTPEQITDLKKIDGVINVLYWLGKPAVVNEQEIALLKSFVASHSKVNAEKTTVAAFNYVHTNSSAVKNNFHTNIGGAYKQQTANMLQLPTIGYKLVAEEHESVVISMNTNQVVAMSHYSTAG